MKEIAQTGRKRGERKYKYETMEVGDYFTGNRNGMTGNAKRWAEAKGLDWEFKQKRLGPGKYKITRIK